MHPIYVCAAEWGIAPEAGIQTGDDGRPLEKKEFPWPKWDGKTDTFANLRCQLRVKIEEDRHLLGSDRAVCYGIL